MNTHPALWGWGRVWLFQGLLGTQEHCGLVPTPTPGPPSTSTSAGENEKGTGPFSHTTCSKGAPWGGGPLLLWPERFAHHQLWILRPMIPKGEQEETPVFLAFLSKFSSLSPSL